ncbi:hypothetical protein SESBI_48320 [Sesbania bispinosa]|nr:hypothetical protein SESBI_48320 [Sesbania bispinosa]
MLCDCGEEGRAAAVEIHKEPWENVWRCPNWNRQMTCNFFKWDDGVVCDMQHPRFEDSHFYEDEIEGLKRKVTKLRKKLCDERVKLKAAFACIILLLVVAMGVFVYIVVNFEGDV